MKQTPTLFARRCDCCGKGMDGGYCIDGGLAYFCSEDCLDASADSNTGVINGIPTVAELCVIIDEEDEDDCDSYWTQWEDEDDYQYQEINGVLTLIEEN